MPKNIIGQSEIIPFWAILGLGPTGNWQIRLPLNGPKVSILLVAVPKKEKISELSGFGRFQVSDPSLGGF